MDIFFDVFLDALIDTVKLSPFLFAAYLLLEYIEHKASKKIAGFLSESKFGIPGGAVLGCIPQCGMSVAASHLFSAGAVSAETLIAVFLSTSDEAIPVILANPSKAGVILPLMLAKVAFAAVAGYLYSLIFSRVHFKKQHNHGAHGCDECEKIEEEKHDHACGGKCENNIFVSALLRSLEILAYILAVNFIMGIIIHYIGEENLSAFMSRNELLQPLFASVVGLIPNCAASVVITELYLSGSLGFGAVFAGLSVGAGIGYIALFKANKNIGENLLIIGYTFVMSVVVGTLIQLLV